MATKKQVKAIDNLVGNGGNVTKAMRDAGYSENTLNTPQKLTESKAFQELMHDQITDQKIIQRINEGLDANKQFVTEQGIVESPDHQTRHKYIETIIKVKGYTRGEVDAKGSIFINGNANFNSKKYVD